MSKWGKYRKLFNNNLCSIPAYEGWVKRSTRNEDMGFCTVCECELRPQKADLDRHSQIAKHKGNASKLDFKQSKITKFVATHARHSHIEAIRYALFIAQHAYISSVDHLRERNARQS